MRIVVRVRPPTREPRDSSGGSTYRPAFALPYALRPSGPGRVLPSPTLLLTSRFPVMTASASVSGKRQKSDYMGWCSVSLRKRGKRNKCKTMASVSTQTVTEVKGTKNKATVSVSTQAVTEEKETKGAISIFTQTVTGAEQPKPVAVAPVQKKKSKSRSVRIVTDEDVAGPSHPAEETEPEIITRSLSLGELRDLRREFTRQTNESILTWLLRIWDAAANDTILDGCEAR
ncbi:hypothetical protein DUI87_03730 [Hirundo rustica rustica]|uniref:Uncharacterized protein n=1 Tax=Hirundo rustica rustica TaxID=333673 RepID=A0A3M0L218_HIRRU|nr:hypothetical protein DUI87_03730 [Hirundo rustica rustica]